MLRLQGFPGVWGQYPHHTPNGTVCGAGNGRGIRFLAAVWLYLRAEKQ
jgi:hypothetical protein